MKHLKTPSRRGKKNTKLLGRLGIRGKLNLLLLLPLAAVLLVATPFVVVQANSAASAGSTADSARYTREVGGLVWELQRERLLTAAYLASPRSDSQAMERQQRKVDDTVSQVRSSLGDDLTEELASALVRVGSLNELRQGALARGVSVDSVARTYHAVVEAVIDSLRLVPQLTSDAEGTRQLTALEALLLSNEYGELEGMALIATAVNRTTGQIVLEDATQQAKMFTERFVQQADLEHAGLVVQVAEGPSALAVEALSAKMPTDSRNTTAVESFANEALNTVGAQSGLRRTVQDRVTSQITDAATARADSAQSVAWLVGGGAAALFALVAALTVVVSRSIANPLKKLTEAATDVAQLAESELVRVSDTEVVEQQVPRLTEINVTSSDEIGQLAVAFNQVQSTAARLVERQAVTRHNVSLMFANVAQRTQNLVGRQLALVDELERNEQDSRLLERLYQLDHLSTRLRRNADNLLVVSGTRTDAGLGGPSLLANAMRSALAEIEDYQRVRLGDMPEVTLPSSLGSDLILVFAELMENATSFSPPDSFVEVSTTFTNEGACVVSIVDHGIGMKPAQLLEENRRLVDRERLDVAPTSVLGLFVVGRLARRHSLGVDLIPTHGGGITARLAIPPALFSRPMPAVPPPAARPVAQPQAPVQAQAQAQPRVQMPGMPEMRIPPAQHNAGFSWFPDDLAAVASSDAPITETPAPAPPAPTPPPVQEPAPAQAAAAPEVASESRAGLKRRVAGAQLPGGASIPPPNKLGVPAAVTPRPVAPPPPPAAPPKHDAAAARAAMDGFQSAFAKASATPPPPLPDAPPAVQQPQAQQPAPKPAQPVTTSVSGSLPAPLSRDGLTRRVPGANLAPGLRNTKSSSPPLLRSAPKKYKARDPEAERASLDAFATGLARALVPEEAVDTDPMKESRA
ncbi:signal transduction histidine kinase [Kibdelosporangium banguiense]|uniref:histidine kinase n=1 Tax=Kibdelosporangium banguiense TaxID=1365924 RepID=A0ABS4T6E7_9PSEU|nr:nitrate- and nitrite sensing domain-containing protein [Kibdelosporangium banguiense]MBP2319997.1 signal transduction histidine kinase [Kibdelosporangium banguiense]